MAHGDSEGGGGSQADRDDQRGDDRPRGGAGARRRAAAAQAAVQAAPAPAPAPAALPLLTPAIVGDIRRRPVPEISPIAQGIVGAINRSSGNTGSSVLNSAAVERARIAGTPFGDLLASVDGSQPGTLNAGVVPFSINSIDRSGL